jgi:hypothetical protein
MMMSPADFHFIELVVSHYPPFVASRIAVSAGLPRDAASVERGQIGGKQ